MRILPKVFFSNGLWDTDRAWVPVRRRHQGLHRHSLVALLAFFLFAPLLRAAPPVVPTTGTTVMVENFTDLPPGPLPKTWRVDGGEWRVVDGKLHGRATKYLSRLFFPIGKDVQDVAVEADIAFLKAKDPGRWLALMVRSSEKPSAPFLIFTSRFDRHQASGLEIGWNTADKKGQRTWHIYHHGQCSIPGETGVFHKVRFEVRGRLARGFIDGKLVMEGVLPKETVVKGQVGLIVSDVTAAFDNVRVEALNPPTPAELGRFVLARCAGPLIIAHRGNSKFAPENTIVSFQEAFAAGADGVEMDLRRSRDGVLYLLHDNTLDRTTNGKGEAAKLSIAELKNFDAGSWKNKKYAGTRIPTFEEVARICAGRGFMLLDLKENGLGAKIAEVVHKTGILDQIVVCCWTDVQLADARKHLPDAVLVKLGSAPANPPADWFRKLRQKGAAGLSLSYSSVTPAFLRKAIGASMPVYVWTLDDASDIEHAYFLGAAGILTDTPAATRSVVDKCRLRAWGL